MTTADFTANRLQVATVDLKKCHKFVGKFRAKLIIFFLPILNFKSSERKHKSAVS